MAGDLLLGENGEAEAGGFFQGTQMINSADWPSGEHPLERNPLWKMASENKENGNNFVKEGNYEQAISKYSELIMQLRSVENSTDVKWNDAERLKVRQLRAAAYLNLSLCFLKGQQWMHASNTATRALQGDKEPADPKENVLEPDKKAKALFRRATAQCEFGNFDKAKADLTQAAEYAPDDKGIQQMLVKCQHAVAKVNKKADKKMAGFLNKAVAEGDGGLFDDSLRPPENPEPKPVKPVEPKKLKDGLFWMPPDESKKQEADEEKVIDYNELTSELAVLKEENPEKYQELRQSMKELLEAEAANIEATSEEKEIEARVKDLAEHAFDDAGKADAPASKEPESA